MSRSAKTRRNAWLCGSNNLQYCNLKSTINNYSVALRCIAQCRTVARRYARRCGAQRCAAEMAWIKQFPIPQPKVDHKLLFCCVAEQGDAERRGMLRGIMMPMERCVVTRDSARRHDAVRHGGNEAQLYKSALAGWGDESNNLGILGGVLYSVALRCGMMHCGAVQCRTPWSACVAL